MNNDIKIHEVEYVLEIENILSKGPDILDASLSFIRKRGPASVKYAWIYFKEKVESEYTNIYGVTNTIRVHKIYRRV